MRSEIPQIEVITAIGEADLEDYVSQLLFTQGWSIIFRAFDGPAIIEYLKARSPELRTVVVYTSDLPNFDLQKFELLATSSLSLISLDNTPHAAHEIMQKIRGQLRIPMIHRDVHPSLPKSHGSPKIVESKRKFLVVTGSSGGPGKTLLATALASELAIAHKVSLIDADFRSAPLSDVFAASEFNIHALHANEKPIELPESELREIVIVDVGVLPPLGEVVNDRRWMALLHNNLFENATELIYVAQSTKSSLLQLSQFKKELPLLMHNIKPTYICVSKGGLKNAKPALDAFSQLTAGDSAHYLSELSLLPTPTGILESIFASGKKARKEIGSIATSLI